MTPLHRLRPFKRRPKPRPEPPSEETKAAIVADVQAQIEDRLSGVTFRGVVSDGTEYEICLIDPKFTAPLKITEWSVGHGC